MELIKHFLILLSALTPQVVAQIAGSTYDQVQAQLNNFQETVYPGIITAAGGTAAKPFSGCAFAVGFNTPFLLYLDITNKDSAHS